MGLKLAGGYGQSGEGSYIVHDEESGYYYLYLSYCGLNATDNFSGYHLRMYRSKDIKGPYTDAAGNNAIYTSASENPYTGSNYLEIMHSVHWVEMVKTVQTAICPAGITLHLLMMTGIIS